MTANKFILLLILLLTSRICLADHQDQLGWSGNASLGFDKNTGNTNNSNLITTGHLNIYKIRWKNAIDFGAQFKANNGIRSEEKYNLSWESQYRFAHDNFLFARGSLEKKRFSPYDYNLYGVAGYGQRLLQGERYWVEAQIGPGFRLLKETGNGTIDRYILYVAGTWHWKLTKASTFQEKLSSEIGSPNTNIRSSTTIKTTLIGNLGMAVSYEMDYDSHIPPTSPNTKHLDTTTNVTLVYDF